MNKTVFNWVLTVIVAIAYILLSLEFDGWAFTWIIWVIYGVYRLASYISDQNKED